MDDVVATANVMEISGIELPMSACGLVDLSVIKPSMRAMYRSPSQWSRTSRFSHLIHVIEGKTGKRRAELWKVRGPKKRARTWTHPEIAEAYIADLERARRDHPDLFEELTDLKRRVSEIELQILGWNEGLE